MCACEAELGSLAVASLLPTLARLVLVSPARLSHVR